VFAFFTLPTLYWGRRCKITLGIFLLVWALLIVAWLVYHSVALRFLVLFIGFVVSVSVLVRILPAVLTQWDLLTHTILRDRESSDASRYARLTGIGSSTFWGELGAEHTDARLCVVRHLLLL
jgi:hypothetical protein